MTMPAVTSCFAMRAGRQPSNPRNSYAFEFAGVLIRVDGSKHTIKQLPFSDVYNFGMVRSAKDEKVFTVHRS